jgi:photosystem II stability/assembly factor-like uncharacterized protein
MSADGKTLLGTSYNGLLRSTDAGQTWATVAGPNADVYGVAYAALGNGDLVASSYSGFWLSKDGGQTWTRLASPTGNGTFFGFSVDAVRRVAPGVLMVTDTSGGTYLSRDDGQVWVRVVAPVDYYASQPGSIAFADAKNGLMVDASGRTFATKDGGLTWEARSLGLGNIPVRMVQFANPQNGWLVAGDGRLYKSTDTGQTWSLMPTAAGVIIANVFFQNETLGWAQRYASGAAFTYTRDGGKTWTEAALPYGVVALRQGEQSWVAVGSSGTIYLSTDSGGTWNAVYTGTLSALTAVAFSDARTVWAVGDGVVLKSDDGGARWATVKLPGVSGVLRDVNFANAKVGWIVGDGGTILGTQDGGKTWRLQASGTSITLNSIRSVDPNTAWVIGGNGAVLATGNGGN